MSEPWISLMRCACVSGSRSSLQPVAGHFERADRHIHADDLLELLVLEQFPQQLALAAAEVEHPLGPAGPQRRHDRPEPLLVQAQGLLQVLLGLVGGPLVLLGFAGLLLFARAGRGPAGRGSAGTSGSGG